jgi:hypothetical protein
VSTTLSSPPIQYRKPEPTVPAAAPVGRRVYAPSRAETAECTCPEFCERDHGNE